MHCRVCERELSDARAVTRYPDRSEQYYRCPFCGSIVLHPLPCSDRNRAFEGHESAETLARRDDQRLGFLDQRLDWLEQAAKSRKATRKLLDVGCGSGRFLKLAQQRGWQVEGVELSAQLAQEARRVNPGVVVHHGDILQLPEPTAASYDAVVALDVLEHVPQPRAMLHRLRQLLQPGGLLLLQTPNAQSLRARLHRRLWNMLIPEYHFHLLTPAGLTGLLSETGFEVLSLRTASGTGLERRPARLLLPVKEKLLSTLRLGNALVVVAKAAHQPMQERSNLPPGAGTSVPCQRQAPRRD